MGNTFWQSVRVAAVSMILVLGSQSSADIHPAAVQGLEDLIRYRLNLIASDAGREIEYQRTLDRLESLHEETDDDEVLAVWAIVESDYISHEASVDDREERQAQVEAILSGVLEINESALDGYLMIYMGVRTYYSGREDRVAMASQYINRAYELFPGSMDSKVAKAWLAQELGQRSEAEVMLEEIEQTAEFSERPNWNQWNRFQVQNITRLLEQ